MRSSLSEGILRCLGYHGAPRADHLLERCRRRVKLREINTGLDRQLLTRHSNGTARLLFRQWTSLSMVSFTPTSTSTAPLIVRSLLSSAEYSLTRRLQRRFGRPKNGTRLSIKRIVVPSVKVEATPAGPTASRRVGAVNLVGSLSHDD